MDLHEVWRCPFSAWRKVAGTWEIVWVVVSVSRGVVWRVLDSAHPVGVYPLREDPGAVDRTRVCIPEKRMFVSGSAI